VRLVPVKDDGMPETPELETINLRALLRLSVSLPDPETYIFVTS
jgi:hypothetical protein